MEMQQVLLQIILVSLFSHIIVSYILYVKVLEKSMKDYQFRVAWPWILYSVCSS